MKYTRIEVSPKLINSKNNAYIWFFIAIPLISIAFGSLSVKFLISPYIKGHSKTVNIDTNIKYVSVANKGLKEVYFLQAGVFSEKDNADMLKAVIKEKGFHPFIVGEKDRYKLVVSIDYDDKNLSKDRDKLKKLGYNSIKNIINIQTQDKELSKNDKELEKYINSLGDLVSIQFDLTKKLGSGGSIDKTNLKVEFDNLVKSFNLIKEKKTGEIDIELIAGFHNQFVFKKDEYLSCTNNKNIEGLNRLLYEETIMLENLFKELKSK